MNMTSVANKSDEVSSTHRRLTSITLAVALAITGGGFGALHADDIKMLTPPCRMHDSRPSGAAKLVSGVELLGGARQNCGIPLTATAVFFSFTVINPPAAGWLKAYAAGLSAAPDTAVLTYQPGVNTTGSALVNLVTYSPTATAADFVMKSSQSTDFLADVVGYVVPSVTNEIHATITSKNVTDCDSNGNFCTYTFGLSNGWLLICNNQNITTITCANYSVGGGIRGFGHIEQSVVESTPILYAHAIVAYP